MHRCDNCAFEGVFHMVMECAGLELTIVDMFKELNIFSPMSGELISKHPDIVRNIGFWGKYWVCGIWWNGHFFIVAGTAIDSMSRGIVRGRRRDDQ